MITPIQVCIYFLVNVFYFYNRERSLEKYSMDAYM